MPCAAFASTVRFHLRRVALLMVWIKRWGNAIICIFLLELALDDRWLRVRYFEQPQPIT
jgi:hypothetical protein